MILKASIKNPNYNNNKNKKKSIQILSKKMEMKKM